MTRRPAEPSTLHPLDVGTEPDQPADEIVVATVDVVHAADDRLAFRGQAGHDQRCPGTDVGGPHRCPAEAGDTTHDCVVAVGADVGTQPLQFLDVAESAGVEVLGDEATG